MKNPIRENSEMYNELCVAYEEIENHKERFQKCYNIVEASDYNEICFVISMLKRSESVTIENIEGFNSIIQIVKAIFSSATNETRMKHVFFLDILEEASERKR